MRRDSDRGHRIGIIHKKGRKPFCDLRTEKNIEEPFGGRYLDRLRLFRTSADIELHRAPTVVAEQADTGDGIPPEVQPKIFYLKDGDGKLQAIPGMTYEQLMEAWKQKNQLSQESVETENFCTPATKEMEGSI